MRVVSRSTTEITLFDKTDLQGWIPQETNIDTLKKIYTLTFREWYTVL